MTCKHEIWEMDTAAHADGLCPLCLKEDNKQLRQEIERLKLACRDQAGVELSEENDRLIEKIEQLRAALQAVINDVLAYERSRELHPNPGRKYCWDSVARAVDVLTECVRAK
jgi:hypothetical protein